MSGITQEKTALIWDLTDLYPDPESSALQADIQQLIQISQAFKDKHQNELTTTLNNTRQLCAALRAYLKIQELSHNLMTYALLGWNVDTTSTIWNSLRDQINRQTTDAAADTEFFRQALAQLSPEALSHLFTSPEIQPFQAMLKKAAAFQPFLLSLAEENMLSRCKTFSRQRWLDFFTQTTSNWHFEVNQNPLSEDEANSYLRKADPELRAAGHSAINERYGKDDQFIAYIFNTLIQEYAQEARLRSFDSTLEQQAFDQQLKSEQVLQLVQEVRQRLPLYQRYYAELAKSLGTNIRSCDLAAPLRAQDWQVSWSEGQNLILEALAPLGEDLVGKTRQFFEKNWIHAQSMSGKTAGAFCAPTAQSHPYILMNWAQNLYSVTVLAHELGHGLHFYETVENQHVLDLMPPLFLAETASTLNEYLLADHLLTQTSDPSEQRFFLSDLLQRMMNGLFRQSQITEFEIFAHQQGAERQLSAAELHQKWEELSRERGGEAIAFSPAEAYGWSRIPHIFIQPFYCYNYTLSNLIVLALIQQYRSQRELFLPRYRQFLQAGGSLDPTQLLAIFELDLNHPAFYQQAFAVLEDLIAQLEALNANTMKERGEQ